MVNDINVATGCDTDWRILLVESFTARMPLPSDIDRIVLIIQLHSFGLSTV